MSDNNTPEPTEQEKLSRERELLLTTFEPSASECTINQVFTEPAEDFSVRDELKPYTGPVSGEEQTA